HRYQTEAAVKLIGGLDYRYALRGDGQFVTRMIDPGMQEEALEALLNTVDPEKLALPESLLEIIPPRPIGYSRGRELVDIGTGLTFDPSAAAGSASTMTFSLLFHPARAQRLISHHARDPEQPSFQQVISRTVEATIKRPEEDAKTAEIGRTVDNMLITALIRLAGNNSASADVRSVVINELDVLHSWLEEQETDDYMRSAHIKRISRDIETFLDDPDEYEAPEIPRIPDGSPIGMD
ncbi:MAG: zinc-dependent metalloprotease, partial [Cyclobacteriaceae bacterium]